MAWYIDLWEQRYPQSIGFLKAGFRDQAASAPVWAAFLATSGLSDDAAKAAVTFVRDSTAPPLIWFTDLGNRAGEFNPDQPNRIQISTTLAEQFETASGQAQAGSYLAAKVLHELVHWGIFHRGATEDVEMGVAFEKAAFPEPLVPFWLDPSSQDDLRREIVAPARPLEDAPVRKLEPGAFGNKDLTAALPRGIRNNNPGNIRRSGERWEGLARPDELKPFQVGESAFCVFSDAVFGIRAMARILQAYQGRIGLRTVAGMINRWAPPNDNNVTDAYVTTVCTSMGVAGNQPFSFDNPDLGARMLGAMIRVENGMQPYSADQLARGHAMATM